MIINVYNSNVVILDFFVIFCLNVKMYLKLYTVLFFVSGQTYRITKGSNNYCSHCTWLWSGSVGICEGSPDIFDLVFGWFCGCLWMALWMFF